MGKKPEVMYGRYQLAKKYLSYYRNALNGKGHGIHSPFVYDFVERVLIDKTPYPEYKQIEMLRRKLLHDRAKIKVDDYGAGSQLTPYKIRQVSDIAASSLKPRKFAQLLFRIVRYYDHQHIVELGTSLGITTCYLAAAKKDAQVTTLEGAVSVAGIAKKQFKLAELENISLIEGDFTHTLPELLPEIKQVDLLFIDGNHRKEATIQYFEAFLNKRQDTSVFILDDIHWSRGMEEAWEYVKQHEAVTLTIDLFFIGLVFFSSDFKVKQHFSIRF